MVVSELEKIYDNVDLYTVKNAIPMVCSIELRNNKEKVMEYLQSIDYCPQHSVQRNQDIRVTTDTNLLFFPDLNCFILLFPTHNPTTFPLCGVHWVKSLFELVWDETQERAYANSATLPRQV